jgi:hypothetical protein
VTGGTRLSFIVIACLSLAVRAYGQVTTLPEAIYAAETANRTIQVAALEHEKALRDVKAVKAQRFPVFSVIALGSQPLNQLGITLERGSLGVYPSDGPIPGQTTTLQSPLRFGFIGYVSVAQPLTQQYKIGLGTRQTLSCRNGVWICEGAHARCTGEFTDDRKTLTARHERSDDGVHWQPSMNVVLRKID